AWIDGRSVYVCTGVAAIPSAVPVEWVFLAVVDVSTVRCVYVDVSAALVADVYCVMKVGYFFFQAEDGIRGRNVTGVQTCALPIWPHRASTVVGCPGPPVPESAPTTSQSASSPSTPRRGGSGSTVRTGRSPRRRCSSS